jgi:hypothetical protein
MPQGVHHHALCFLAQMQLGQRAQSVARPDLEQDAAGSFQQLNDRRTKTNTTTDLPSPVARIHSLIGRNPRFG